MNAPLWIVLLTYGSLLLELLFFPVPSVVSSHQMVHESRGPGLHRLGQSLRALLVGGFFFLPLVVVLFPGLLPLTAPGLADPHPLALCGGVLCILVGRFLSLSTALHMRRGQKLFHGDEPNELITGSLFRFSRNPIALGLLLMYGGLLILLPHLLIGIGMILLTGHMHDKVRREEAHLATLYGEAYLAYREKTRRYF